MKYPLLLVAVAAVAAPLHAGIDASSFPSLAFQQHPGAQLPLDAQLTDARGRTQTLGAALGDRPSVLVLEYLSCKNLCGLVLAGAVHALGSAGLVPGRDVDLVAVSIDPRDTTADAASARARYAATFANRGALDGIHFLTGSPAQVSRIASAVGFPYRYDRQSAQFAHPAGVVVTTPGGRISRYMLGVNPAPAEMKQAIGEAARGATEPAAHPLLLLCFGYDPDAGTAAALAMRLVRFASLGVVLACALMVVFLSLRRKRAA